MGNQYSIDAGSFSLQDNLKFIEEEEQDNYWDILYECLNFYSPSHIQFSSDSESDFDFLESQRGFHICQIREDQLSLDLDLVSETQSFSMES